MGQKEVESCQEKVRTSEREVTDAGKRDFSSLWKMEKSYKSVYSSRYLEVKRKHAEQPSHFEVSAKASRDELSQLADEWLHSAKLAMKESSFTRYHRGIHRYILPYFKDEKLNNITLNAINRFKGDLHAGCSVTTKPLAPKTVADILSILKMFLEYCEKEGYVCPDFKRVTSIKPCKKAPSVLPNSLYTAKQNCLS